MELVASRLADRATLSDAVGPSRYLRAVDKTYVTAGEHSGRIPEGFRDMAEANYKQGIFALQLIIIPLEALLIVLIAFGAV